MNHSVYCRVHKKTHRAPECLKPEEPQTKKERARAIREQDEVDLADARVWLKILLARRAKREASGEKIPLKIKQQIADCEVWIRRCIETLGEETVDVKKGRKK